MTCRPTALLLSSLWLLACAKPENGNTDAGTSTSGEETLGMGVTSASHSDPGTVPTTDVTNASSVTFTTVPETTDPTVPTTVTDSTSTSTTEGTFGTESSATTFSSTTTFTSDSSTTSQACPDPENQQQSAQCTDASGCGCASGKCFLVPILGGWCGECLVDSDCGDGGCTIPDPIGNIGATCNMGEKGAGCMSDDVCSDPGFDSCATILEVPGVITVSTCSDCATNADCPQGKPNCGPVYDIANFTGVNICVASGSVPNNNGCNLEPDGMGDPVGNKACSSGFCGEADVMGLLKMGICGECNANSDCQPGQSCTDPLVDLNAAQLIGSTCQ